MNKKLAVGLFCAVLCGLNLAYTRGLLAAEGQGDCTAVSCFKESTCRLEYSCQFCWQARDDKPGVCIPYF